MPRHTRREPMFRYRRHEDGLIVLAVRCCYLYRAVDKSGRTVDYLLRPDRGMAAAQALIRKARESDGGRFPRKVILDGHVPSHSALWRLRREHPFLEECPGSLQQVPQQQN